MKVRLIYGRAGSGKSFRCKEEILSQICENDFSGDCGEGLLIVPEQFGYMAEHGLVEDARQKGILDAEVLSFTRLAHKIAGEVSGRARRKLTQNGKAMLLYRTFMQNKDQFEVFKLAADKPGFVTVVADLIAEFKRYNHTPEQLATVTEKLDDSLLKKKLQELSFLYSLYQARLEQKVYDTEDMLDLLAQNIPHSAYIKNCSVWIDEFFGFTKQEMNIISQLMLHARQVTISLCMDEMPTKELDEIDLFAPTKRAYFQLSSLCRAHEISPELVHLEPRNTETETPALFHLERELFAIKPEKFEGEPKEISITKSANIFSEIELVAQTIVSLVKDDGLAFQDIAIVSGAHEAYNGLISAVFKAYALPFFMDEKPVISLNPLVRFVVSALQILADGWKYRDVFSYLRTGMTGIEESKIDVLEEYVIANNIHGNMWLSEDDWAFRINGYFSDEPTQSELEEMQMVDATRRAIAKPLQGLKDATIYGKPASEMVRAVFAFLQESEMQEKIIARQEQLIAQQLEEKANEYVQTWNLIIEVIDQIEEAFGDEKLTSAQLLELFQVAANGSNIGSVPLNLNRIFVGDIARSRTQDIKVMFLVGVNEGVFPAAAKPEGLLSDQDREKLRESGLDFGLAPTVKQTLFDDQILAYATLTTPTKRLFVSYPLADGHGKGLRPSSMIARIRRIFTALKVESQLSDSSKNLNFESRNAAFQSVVSEMREIVEGPAEEASVREAFRWFLAHDEQGTQLQKLVESLDYDGSVDNISAEKAIALYGDEIFSSVSKMEKFAQCPFSFFVQYGLKAKLRQQFDFEPKDEGTLSHEILEKYFKEINTSKIDLKTMERVDSDALVNKIMDEILGSAKVNKSFAENGKYLFMLARIRDTLKTSAWVNALNLSVGKFVPEYFELKFGKNTDLKPIELDLGNCKMTFTGFIDRVDVYQEGETCFLKVVDYKTGQKEFKLNEVYQGLQLQLISYLIVLKDGLGALVGATCLPGAVFYQEVKNPMIDALPGASEETIADAVRENLKPSGLIANDTSVLLALDNSDDPVSKAIRIKYKDGVPSGKHLADYIKVEALQKHALKKLTEFGKQMATGNTGVAPIKDGQSTACDWCDYKKICLFNGRFTGCRYKKLTKLKDDEIWTEIIRQEGADVDKMD